MKKGLVKWLLIGLALFFGYKYAKKQNLFNLWKKDKNEDGSNK